MILIKKWASVQDQLVMINKLTLMHMPSCQVDKMSLTVNENSLCKGTVSGR